MAKQGHRPVGLTKDVGFQIGARRTLPVRLEHAWRYLLSAEGQRLWLGTKIPIRWESGQGYQLEDGTRGEVRVFRDGSHLRMTWHPSGWARASTIQLRVIGKAERSVVAFHQEHLPDAEAREQRRAHYLRVLDQLESIFSSAG